MTTSNKNVDMSMMTHVPLQPHWLVQLPAFQSSEAAVVRGCLNMLVAAFYGQPCGTLPDDPAGLATAAALPADALVEHYKLLTAGWKKTKGRITFEPMAQMGQRLNAEYGHALQRLQDGVAVAIAAPDLFNTELLPAQGVALQEQVTGKTKQLADDLLGQRKVPRLLPENTPITESIREALVEQGFLPTRHEEVWQMFKDRHHSQGTRSANWVAEFRHWLRNQIHYGRLAPEVGSAASVTAAPPSNAPRAGRARFTFTANKPISEGRGGQAQERSLQSLQRARNALAARNAAGQTPPAQTDGVVL